MGPLAGIRVLEIGGLGPVPFAAMLLADHGADVVRIDRDGGSEFDSGALLRSRRILNLDLKSPAGAERLRSLARVADVLIEGFRPGVMERLGLGPNILCEENPALVYGRMTGWGQTGPYSAYPGHDLNYISLSGALHAIGPKGEPPVPPLALVGDFGGGGMFLAFSVCAALHHARATGQGQVIDCAMTEGAGLLMTQFYSMLAMGQWKDERGSNLIDGGSHFYNTFETADGRYVSVAAESQFYPRFCEALGLSDDPAFDARSNPIVWPKSQRATWPELRNKVADVFKTKTRDEWCALLEEKGICFAPVLSMTEAPSHPHAVARGSFVEVDGVVQPAPAPRYSSSPLEKPRQPRLIAADEADVWEDVCSGVSGE